MKILSQLDPTLLLAAAEAFKGANPYHRTPNTVRTKPRRPFKTGPVLKGKPFGRVGKSGKRYT